MGDGENFENGRIAGLQVVSALGSGGFGSVWLAHDPKIDRLVAVKVLRHDMAADPELRMRFIQEARFLDKAGTDLVVGVHNLDELPDGRPYIVMEFAQGGSLDDRLVKNLAPGGASRAEMTTLIHGLGRCLNALHRAGLVHRDIKPANVLIRRREPAEPAEGQLFAEGEQLVLADFGVARTAGTDAVSAASIVVHSYGWSAPEQMLSAQAPTNQADLFAASMIVLWAATGEAPQWTGQSPIPVQVPASLDARGPGFRAELLRGLAFSANDRHENAAAWTNALAKSLNGNDRPGAVPASPTSVAPPSPQWAPPTQTAATPQAPPGDWAPPVAPQAPPAQAPAAQIPAAQIPAAGATVAAGPSTEHAERPGSGTVASLQPPAGPWRRRVLVGLVGLIGLMAVGTGAFAAVNALGGSSLGIVGPERASVGDAVVFATEDGGEVDWIVAGQTTRAATASITPTQPGVLVLEASDGEASRNWQVTVDEAPTMPIAGPALIAVGDAVAYSVPSAPSDATIVWSDGSSEVESATLTLRPGSVGVVMLEARVTAGDGSETTTIRPVTVGS